MNTELMAPQQITPMQMIAQASSRPDVSIERMAQLFELQLRWEANEAKKAFSSAFAAFKAEAVTIVKNTDVKAGPLAGTKYANLFDVVNAVIPALSKHGLSHSWKLSKDEKDWMEVTCTMTHALGHSESVSMGAAPDTGPGRNAIQARGSAKSYLERYTLLAATGMAAGGTDDDGAGGGKQEPVGLSDEDYLSWASAIENASSLASLKTTYELALTAADVAKDKKSKGKFIDLKDKRKEELR